MKLTFGNVFKHFATSTLCKLSHLYIYRNASIYSFLLPTFKIVHASSPNAISSSEKRSPDFLSVSRFRFKLLLIDTSTIAADYDRYKPRTAFNVFYIQTQKLSNKFARFQVSAYVYPSICVQISHSTNVLLAPSDPVSFYTKMYSPQTPLTMWKRYGGDKLPGYSSHFENRDVF